MSNSRMMFRVFSTLYVTVFLFGILFGRIYFTNNSNNNLNNNYHHDGNHGIRELNQQYYQELDQQMNKEEQSFQSPTVLRKTTTNNNHNSNNNKSLGRIRKLYKSYDLSNNNNNNDQNNGNSNNGNEEGLLSQKGYTYFHTYQNEIDTLEDRQRCQRYGFGTELRSQNQRRNIYFGSLIASEPWELFEIVGTEAYNIYEGIVLVESNRTQAYHPRNVTRALTEQHRRLTESIITELFFDTTTTAATATETTTMSSSSSKKKKVQIRYFFDERHELKDMEREHAQRQDILRGWKELGMETNDVGILSDIDEVFTRDFLRAIQVCDNIPQLSYDTTQCRPDLMGLRATTQVYEGSPECITDDRSWYHPSIFVGGCLEEIGDVSKHPTAPRTQHSRETKQYGERLAGWGHTWPSRWNESNPYIPLSNGGDFRDMGAYHSVKLQQPAQHHASSYQQISQKHRMEHTAYRKYS